MFVNYQILYSLLTYLHLFIYDTYMRNYRIFIYQILPLTGVMTKALLPSNCNRSGTIVENTGSDMQKMVDVTEWEFSGSKKDVDGYIVDSPREKPWGESMGESARSFTDFVLSPLGAATMVFFLVGALCIHELRE